MPLAARSCDLSDILPMREQYRAEMNCQIIHDSIHSRPGWTLEYMADIDGAAAAYASVAVGGPWRRKATLYEFYALPPFRSRIFELFTALLETARPKAITTQTNAPLLATMLHTFAPRVSAGAILFEDRFQTSLEPPGASFRQAAAADAPLLKAAGLDEGAEWVVTRDGAIVASGGVLYHYNRPYGDIYMDVAAAHRRQGLGAYIVQELKAVCRAGGSVPAARCNVKNEASRRTLQKAGFVPCGNLIEGNVKFG